MKQLVLAALLLRLCLASGKQKAHLEARSAALQIQLRRFPDWRSHQLGAAKQLVQLRGEAALES